MLAMATGLAHQLRIDKEYSPISQHKLIMFPSYKLPNRYSTYRSNKYIHSSPHHRSHTARRTVGSSAPLQMGQRPPTQSAERKSQVRSPSKRRARSMAH